MDYSLLLAVHNITEELKSTQKLSPLSLLPTKELSSFNEPITSDIVTNPSSSIHEEITTISTDSGIALTTISNLPTYIQYLRVIEFIRTQQESSMSNIEHSLSDNHLETASIKTVKPDVSPTMDTHEEILPHSNEEKITIIPVIPRTNSKSLINIHNPSSPFHMANGLIGGDVWYNRQSLSRLAMYDLLFFLFLSGIFSR
jgi:hypothetical protein